MELFKASATGEQDRRGLGGVNENGDQVACHGTFFQLSVRVVGRDVYDVLTVARGDGFWTADVRHRDDDGGPRNRSGDATIYPKRLPGHSLDTGND